VRTLLLDAGGHLREGDNVLARFQTAPPEALGQILVAGNRYDIVRPGRSPWHMQLLDADGGRAPMCEFLPFHRRRGGKLVSESATFTLRGDGFWRPAGWVLERPERWHVRATVRPYRPTRGPGRGLEEIEEWRVEKERAKANWSAALRDVEIAAFAASYEVRLAGSSLPDLTTADILAIAFASWLVVKWAEAAPLTMGG
jgi:hypothetical protein